MRNLENRCLQSSFINFSVFDFYRKTNFYSTFGLYRSFFQIFLSFSVKFSVTFNFRSFGFSCSNPNINIMLYEEQRISFVFKLYRYECYRFSQDTKHFGLINGPFRFFLNIQHFVVGFLSSNIYNDRIFDFISNIYFIHSFMLNIFLLNQKANEYVFNLLKKLDKTLE